MKNLIFLLFLSINLYAQEIDQKPFYLPNTDIDVTDYNLSLNLLEISSNLDIAAKLKISLNVLKERSTLKLHSKRGSVILDEVKVNGKIVGASFINDYVLEIDFPLTVGKKLDVELSYKITKEQLKGEKRGLFYSDSVLSIENWPYYTRRWMPSNDSPFDPARFEISVNVPLDYQVMSNGILTERKKGFFRWKTKESIPTYGINLVIGKYREINDVLCINTGTVNNIVTDCNSQSKKIPLHMYLPSKTSEAEFQSQWKNVKNESRSVAFFSSMMGMYNFEKVGFISAQQSFNMEYPSLITGLGANVHEIAHHWFGDSVFIGHWGDLWISEGFTTYLDHLYNEAYGNNDIEQAMTTPDGQFNYQVNTDPYKIFDNKPYNTGSASVHALRRNLREACGFETGKNQDKKMIYAIMRSIFQKYQGQRLETWTLVKFLKLTLQESLEKANCSLRDEKVKSIVNDWSRTWFHQF